MSNVQEEADEEGGVWFYGPYDRPQAAQLKLRNGAKRPVAFRLKCNHASSFHIKPSGVGVLQPNESQYLTLTALPGASEFDHSALMLELVTVAERKAKDKDKPVQRTAIDPIAAWNQVNLGNLKKTAIPIFFSGDAIGDDDEEIMVVLINETMMAATSQPMKRMYQRVRRRYPDAWWLFTISLILIALISFLLGLFLGVHLKRRREEEK